MELEGDLDLGRARAVPFQFCKPSILYVGRVVGDPAEDCEGRAIVLRDGAAFAAGYVSGGTCVLPAIEPFATLAEASRFAEAFTRAACAGLSSD
jgi:hypothetical protein